MKTALNWILLILLAVGGIVGTYALSEKFRTDAREVWEAKAAQSGRWLSGTVLTWLEESYAPLSGLAILFWGRRMPWKPVPPPFSWMPRPSHVRGRREMDGPSNFPMIPLGLCLRTLRWKNTR